MAARPTTITIHGMHSPDCAAHIQTHLSEKHHLDASVHYPRSTATVAVSSAESLTAALRGIKELGYDAQCLPPHGGSAQVIARRSKSAVIASLLTFLMLPTTLLTVLQFPAWQFVHAACATVVVCGFAAGVHRDAARQMIGATPPTDLPASLAMLGLWGWSGYALAIGLAPERQPFVASPLWLDMPAGSTFWSAAAAVGAVAMWARVIRAHRSTQVTAALDRLRARSGDYVTVVERTGYCTSAVGELRIGDVVLVPHDTPVPCDGVIVDGEGTFTALPIGTNGVTVRRRGDAVYAGAVNHGDTVQVQATAVGSGSALHEFLDLVEASVATERCATRSAPVRAAWVRWGVLPGAVGLAVWGAVALGNVAVGVAVAAAVLMLVTPGGWGLSPAQGTLSWLLATAEKGVAVRPDVAVPAAVGTSLVVFNRTGTLTDGRYAITELVVAEGWTESAVVAMAYAAAVAEHSAHPISRALADYAVVHKVATPQVEGFVDDPGFGLRGNVTGHRVQVGKTSWFADIPADVARTAQYMATRGDTPVVLAVDHVPVAVFAAADGVREGARGGVAQLAKQGLAAAVLSSNSRQVTGETARAAGVEMVLADVPATAKASRLADLQADGAVVAVVADARTDATALAQADLEVSVGAETDVAARALDVTIIGRDMRRVADAFECCQAMRAVAATHRRTVWGYHVAALPVAVCGLLHPLLAVAAAAAAGAALTAGASQSDAPR